MNIKEYIESGILDAYVLGALTDEECRQVEADMAAYPELAEEKSAIEEAMLNMAEEEAITPPDFMKEQIWAALNKEDKEESTTPENAPPPQTTPSIPLTEEEAPEQPRPAWQRAAIWAAIMVSVLTNFMLLSQRNESREQNQELASKIDSISTEQEQLIGLVKAYQKEKDLFADPSMETIVMRKEDNDKVVGLVYWSKDKGEAYLAFNNMPLPPKGKQYQLWVIQNGKPIDMGVIPNEMVSNGGAIEKISKSVSSGQAFAISVEKEGGNPTPTKVYMVGAIPS